MSFCSNCGTELTEGSAFCPNCGAGQVRQFSVQEQPAPAPEVVPAEPVYQEPVPVYQPVYQQPVYQPQVEVPAALPTSAKILGLISMICGLASLVSCYVGFSFAIPALILSGIASRKAPGVPNGKAKVGKITGIFGIILSVISFIAYVALLTGEFFVSSDYYY